MWLQMLGIWNVIVSEEFSCLMVSFTDPRPGHYEWQIRFTAGDVDMSTVRARFGQDGKLTIEVQRRTPGQNCTPRLGMGFRYRHY